MYKNLRIGLETTRYELSSCSRFCRLIKPTQQRDRPRKVSHTSLGCLMLSPQQCGFDKPQPIGEECVVWGQNYVVARGGVGREGDIVWHQVLHVPQRLSSRALKLRADHRAPSCIIPPAAAVRCWAVGYAIMIPQLAVCKPLHPHNVQCLARLARDAVLQKRRAWPKYGTQGALSPCTGR